jgi:hypothetical protein
MHRDLAAVCDAASCQLNNIQIVPTEADVGLRHGSGMSKP